MKILCTRPGCPQPQNTFDDLDHATTLKTVQQRFCKTCGMPLILGGRYIPLKLLGKGGFGAAFLACDRHSTKLRQCVVKQFQPASHLDPKALEVAQGLFEREATVLEEIGSEHPQIPDLFAFFPLVIPNSQGNQEEQYFYLVQEFIDGENLEEEVERKGKLSENEVIEILKSILPVLQYIHQKDIIHRDIKPSNIMRDKTNKLYLLDFGAVKQIKGANQAQGSGNRPARLTGIYSIGFAPPEQILGRQVYPSSDLYALAATCLYLLTGLPTTELFDDQSNTWNWRSHLPKISEPLGTILDKLLDLNPQNRYQSAEEVLNILNKQPIIPQSPKTTLQKPITPPSPPPVVSHAPSPSRFSTPKILMGSAFTGFEGTLLMIAGASLLGTGGMIIAGMAIAGLIFAQWRKWIEGKDLPIIAVISAGLLMLIPTLQGSLGLINIFVCGIAVSAGLTGVCILVLIIYRILKRFL